MIIFSIVESAVVFTCFHTWNDFKLYARLHPRLSTNVRLGEDTNENARWRIHSVGSAFVTVRRYQYHYKRLNLPIFGGGCAQAGSPKNPPLVMSHD